MIYLTAAIFLAAAATFGVFLHQANLMQDTLTEMQGAGQQTERLIILNTAQLLALSRSAENMKTLAAAAQQSARTSQQAFSLQELSD